MPSKTAEGIKAVCSWLDQVAHEGPICDADFSPRQVCDALLQQLPAAKVFRDKGADALILIVAEGHLIISEEWRFAVTEKTAELNQLSHWLVRLCRSDTALMWREVTEESAEQGATMKALQFNALYLNTHPKAIVAWNARQALLAGLPFSQDLKPEMATAICEDMISVPDMDICVDPRFPRSVVGAVFGDISERVFIFRQMNRKPFHYLAGQHLRFLLFDVLPQWLVQEIKKFGYRYEMESTDPAALSEVQQPPMPIGCILVWLDFLESIAFRYWNYAYLEELVQHWVAAMTLDNPIVDHRPIEPTTGFWTIAMLSIPPVWRTTIVTAANGTVLRVRQRRQMLAEEHARETAASANPTPNSATTPEAHKQHTAQPPSPVPADGTTAAVQAKADEVRLKR